MTTLLPPELEARKNDIRGIVEHDGAELVDLVVHRSRGRHVLEFVVDRQGGIRLEECARINERLSAYFDEIAAKEEETGGFFGVSYLLEVNSPGLDRPLITRRDFERATGDTVRVSFREPSGRMQTVTGQIVSADDASAALVVPKTQEPVRVPLADITRAVREIRVEHPRGGVR